MNNKTSIHLLPGPSQHQHPHQAQAPAPSWPQQGQQKQVKSRRKAFLAEDSSDGKSQPLMEGAAPGERSLQAALRCPKRVQRGPQGWRPTGTDERKGLSRYQSAQERRD